MKIFEFDNYKEFVTARLKSMPKLGRGQYRKIALALSMQPTLVSQVFNGDRNLTLEQACGLCDYLGLNELETEYFLAMLEHERAGSEKLKRVIQKRINGLKAQALQLVNRLPRDKELTEENKAIFYSTWHYSGVSLLSSIPKFRTIDAISDFLGVPRSKVSRIVEFLVSCGLCVEEGEKVRMGSQRTFLSNQSVLASRHHINWRHKAFERYDSLSDQELVFTAPLSVSEKDGKAIRARIVELIESVGKVVSNTDPEKLACLNIDWVDVRPK
jgi:uncharacterized protein (TIGR02147 family)